VLVLERLGSELVGACGDAGIAACSLVVYVAAASRPPGTTPLAYLNPAGAVRPETVAVFQAVGAGRAERDRGQAHRLAVWRELPGIPPAALGPMLRHELEHARRFELSGPRFFEADDLLRAAVRGAGHEAYAALPSELEANAASAAYAARTLAAVELDELRAVPECASLLDPSVAPADIVGATLTELARRRELPRGWADEVREACDAWDRTAAAALRERRDRPAIVLC
jgi:hypothetical protein